MFTSQRPMNSRTRRFAVRLAAPVLLISLAPTAVGATPMVPTQSVESIRAKAEKLAAEIDRLDEQTSILDEQQNEAAEHEQTGQQHGNGRKGHYSVSPQTLDALLKKVENAHLFAFIHGTFPLSYHLLSFRAEW